MDGKTRTPILVEFPQRPGAVRALVTKDNLEELQKASDKALLQAMDTIQEVSLRVDDLHKRLPVEFSEVALEFGLTLDIEAGALIAKVGTQASIKVTLTWKRPESNG